MSQLRNHLRVLTALVMALAVLACAVPASIFAGSPAAAEALEVVSSYPYTTTTKVKVNLRAGRSTRSTLIKKIPGPAGTLISCFLQTFWILFLFPLCVKFFEKKMPAGKPQAESVRV